jgi:Secretion system C-terminal sorting domain
MMSDMKTILFFSLVLCTSSNAQWHYVPEIQANRLVYSLLSVQDTIYAGTDSVVYRGTNNGTDWFAGLPPLKNPDIIGNMLKYRDTLILGTYKHGIFISSNEGLSWQSFNSGLSGLGATSISSILLRRDSLIVGTLGAGVFITKRDFSQPWTHWSDSLIDYQGDNVYKMLVVNNTVFAGAGVNGYMFRYSDAQPWWNPIPINTPKRLVGQNVLSMASDAIIIVTGTNTGIYRSVDDGLSWQRTDPVVPTIPFRILTTYHDSTWFVVKTTAAFTALQKSSDQGQTWEPLGVFPIANVFDIAIVGETFYLGGEQGLWRTSLTELITSIAEKGSTTPVFELRQNYPNPFNPATTISYHLARRSQVLVSVFDMLGRDVADLVNEIQQPGSYSVRWDAVNVASGIYFYQLRIGAAVETRKMVLLR